MAGSRNGFEDAGEEWRRLYSPARTGTMPCARWTYSNRQLKTSDGILVSPIDKEVMIGPINDAIAKGIPVACVDNDPEQ